MSDTANSYSVHPPDDVDLWRARAEQAEAQAAESRVLLDFATTRIEEAEALLDEAIGLLGEWTDSLAAEIASRKGARNAR